MKKQFIASVLALSMTLSMLPMSAFAEEAEAPTPAEVGAAVETAKDSATDAGQANAASGQIITAVDEALAAANEKLAQDNLDIAKDVIDQVNDANTKRAEEAEAAENTAKDANTEANTEADKAQGADSAAQDALTEAETAKKKGQAEAAADKAEAKAEEAKDAAANAQTAAVTASEAAAKAQKAYEDAQIAAAQAEANAKQQLEAGLINAEQAEALTKKAAEQAAVKLKEMEEAQAKANAAKDAAKADADAAKETLKAESEKLAEIAKDNAEEIAKDTANAAVTGAALEASKIAVEIASKVVDAYEGELEDLKGQVEELDKAIADADAAIADANEKLAALDEDDAEYPKAKAALEAAEAAKTVAENEKAKADAVLENRTQEKMDKMTGLQAQVKDADLTTDEGKTAVKDLTSEVLGYDKNTYGEIEWQEDTNGQLIFKSTVTAEDGTETVQYYEAKKDENGVLQYYKTDRKEDHTVSNLPTASKEQYDSMVDGKLVYEVVDASGEKTDGTVSVKETKIFGKKLYSYEITINGKTTALVKDITKGGYYYMDGFTRVDVTLEDPNTIVGVSYDTAADAVGNSNSVTDGWKDAEKKVAEAEAKVAEAEANVQNAKESYDTAKKAYDEAKDALDAVIAENGENKAASQEQIDELQGKIKDLNLKLNGNLADQVVRDALDGYQEGGIQGAIAGAATGAAGKTAGIALEIVELNGEKAALEAKKLFGRATEEELARLELLPTLIADKQQKLDEAKNELGNVDEIVSTVTDLATVMDHLKNGEFGKEDLEKAVKLLGSTTVSAKTRQSIAELVESIMETKHQEAVKELQDAVAKAEEELAKQGEVVAAASQEALKAELAYADAAAKAAVADAAAKHFQELKDKADKAAADAATARKAYEDLKNTVKADSTLLETMKNAAENAEKLAAAAQAAADAAKVNADTAKEAAVKAREIADKFPVPKRNDDSAAEAPVHQMTIAEYAYSLLGPLPAGFPSDTDSARFVELVYAHFGIKLDLEKGCKPQDAVKNGTRLERSMARSSDVTCMLSTDGMVDVFGIYYGSGVYIFYNEATHMVETARTADAPCDWFPLRVIK